MNEKQIYFKKYLKYYFLANEEKNISRLKTDHKFIQSLPFQEDGKLSLLKFFKYDLKANDENLPYKMFLATIIYSLFSTFLYLKYEMSPNIVYIGIASTLIFGSFFVGNLGSSFIKWMLLKNKKQETLTSDNIKLLTNYQGVDSIFFKTMDSDQRTIDIFKNKFPDILLTHNSYTYNELYNLLKI